MYRTCFFCHRPLTVRQRASVFCSLRCQALYARLAGRAAPEGPRAGSDDPEREPACPPVVRPIAPGERWGA